MTYKISDEKRVGHQTPHFRTTFITHLSRECLGSNPITIYIKGYTHLYHALELVLQVFCSTSVPLASTRWVWSTLSFKLSTCSTQCAVDYLSNIRKFLWKITLEPWFEPGAAGSRSKYVRYAMLGLTNISLFSLHIALKLRNSAIHHQNLSIRSR